LPPGELDPKECAVARRLSIILTLASALVLTACFPLPGQDAAQQTAPPVDLPPIEFTGELEPGACLESSHGRRSDRETIVPCTEPHRYDVVAVDEWPGMADAIAKLGARGVWETMTGDAYVPQAEPDGYRVWADRVCSDAVRDAIGWDSLSVRGLGADELWLEPMGGFEIDASLAGRTEFDEGDHRTVCSIAWPAALAYPEGVTIERLTSSGMPSASRLCLLFVSEDAWGSEVDCADPHTDQMILRFDARVALGEEFLVPEERFAPGAYDELSYFCTDAVDVVFEGGDPDFYAWGQTSTWPVWSFDEADKPFPEWRYFVECAVSRYDGEEFTGDAFEAVARRGDDSGV
jgi:hypothetical protein